MSEDVVDLLRGYATAVAKDRGFESGLTHAMDLAAAEVERLRAEVEKLREAIEDALGRHQVTHIHAVLRAVLGAVPPPEEPQ